MHSVSVWVVGTGAGQHPTWGRHGQALAGLYLLKIYERIKGASPAAFPTLSTPTEVRLDPGRYWMWARDPATGRTSDRTLVRVAGQTELPIDLPVP